MKLPSINRRNAPMWPTASSRCCASSMAQIAEPVAYACSQNTPSAEEIRMAARPLSSAAAMSPCAEASMQRQ
jgi:hypothetical protein